jgi:hypothetical protein
MKNNRGLLRKINPIIGNSFILCVATSGRTMLLDGGRDNEKPLSGE